MMRSKVLSCSRLLRSTWSRGRWSIASTAVRVTKSLQIQRHCLESAQRAAPAGNNCWRARQRRIGAMGCGEAADRREVRRPILGRMSSRLTLAVTPKFSKSRSTRGPSRRYSSIPSDRTFWPPLAPRESSSSTILPTTPSHSGSAKLARTLTNTRRWTGTRRCRTFWLQEAVAALLLSGTSRARRRTLR
jgi:hypothetical protein